MAIVADEYGGVVGVVTLADLLAEVMGDVGDEFKLGQPEPETLPDGRVRLPGLMRPDETEHWLGSRWRGSDADTVSGHIINALGRMPQPGVRIVLDGVEVEVERVDRHFITSLFARPVTDQETQGNG